MLDAAEHLASGTGQAEGAAAFFLPAAAFLAIISLFMPVASAMGFSVNCFSDEVGGEGGFLLSSCSWPVLPLPWQSSARRTGPASPPELSAPSPA
ncbi:hypothetical protein ACIQVK_18505 [Streptomyces sp. NPDC090493]|uniref:hypothetical protein n=1 Tax=Streptomyces sp. NPDC090493 TaxID=3365964 RepID=UPI003821F2F7